MQLAYNVCQRLEPPGKLQFNVLLYAPIYCDKFRIYTPQCTHCRVSPSWQLLENSAILFVAQLACCETYSQSSGTLVSIQ